MKRRKGGSGQGRTYGMTALTESGGPGPLYGPGGGPRGGPKRVAGVPKEKTEEKK